ncbi:uncharacterized protein BKCO1_4300067 [Diplodia corticola]|uniref:Secreted protein n=1 Tax=Diplodia corticola TaxID=236234 RepID=A0A1J9RWM6_9PEZI|nr:uncharacterized protein BKCO1_4300067 [Diplodia corticola]OJD31885.1 secreted protein [Diplodia corticola]
MQSSILVVCSMLLAVFASAIDGSHSVLSTRQGYVSPVTRANFTLDELYKLQVRFWDNFVYNNTAQAASINSTLLAPDVLGRVDVTRGFDGQELNTEYLFGLFANLANQNSTSSTLLGVPVSYDIIHFAGTQDISSAATIVFFKNAIFGTFPVEIDSWITWNEQGQIWQYDATYRWFANLLDATIEAAAGAKNTTYDATVAALADSLATSICNTAQAHCTTPETRQYADFDECHATLTRDKPFGKPYELGGDTLLCRMVHENMVPLRPEVHCPHIGPGGGGMCVDDLTYAQRVLQEYYTHAPMVPAGYESGNASVDAW